MTNKEHAKTETAKKNNPRETGGTSRGAVAAIPGTQTREGSSRESAGAFLEAQAKREARTTKKEALHARREAATALRAWGYTYQEIADRSAVSISQAYNDIQIYLRDASRFFHAGAYREQIAETYRQQIKLAGQEIRRLGAIDDERHREGKPLLYVEQRMKCSDRIMRALEGQAKLYGYQGESAASLSVSVISAGETIVQAPSWLQGMPQEHVVKLRDQMIAFRNLVAVSANVTEEPSDEAGSEGPSDSDVPEATEDPIP